jgi:AraC-like DNA-binding protein
VRSLVKGRDGRIWIATDEGLAFVSPDAPNTVINANYCYGVNREYTRGAAQNLPDGNIVFGTTTGAIVIHPDNVQSINYTAHLVIMGVSCSADQESLQTEQVNRLLDKGELSLSYDQRTFEIQFESVNMRNHFDIAYRYQVGNGEWSLPSDQQYIRFVNMEPGQHLLTLQCISRTNGTVIDTKTLIITIGQPWWNTWWMWCIYIALVLLTFYGAWFMYQLHEKYMRLTIDHLQTVEPTIVDTPQQPIPEKDGGKEFVDNATQLIVDHLSDSEFTIDHLCREMAMSRTLFYVKLKSYTGKSPQDFMRIIRLERAASMLRNGCNVTDAATQTGFDNHKYFSTVFKKYFGVSPSKYV